MTFLPDYLSFLRKSIFGANTKGKLLIFCPLPSIFSLFLLLYGLKIASDFLLSKVEFFMKLNCQFPETWVFEKNRACVFVRRSKNSGVYASLKKSLCKQVPLLLSQSRRGNQSKSSLPSVLEYHEKSDLDPDQDHLLKSYLRSRSDHDLTWKYDLQIVI